ncbi:MGDG synthase family glycosyltransferase [Clostridium sp. DL1XJH146]
MKKVDVLILSASFGEGHNSTAKAIRKSLISDEKNLEVEIVDYFNIITPNIAEYYYKGYEVITDHFPAIYNMYYYAQKKIEKNPITNIIFETQCTKILELIEEYTPKVIVSTFPVCSAVISKLKEKDLTQSFLVTCVTDVVFSYEWVHPKTDLYLLPSGTIKDEFIANNISEKNIIVTGIPIREEFIYDNENNLYEKRRHADENYKTRILLMGGARGLFDLSDSFFSWLDNLEAANVTVITGHNKELYENLKQNNQNINVHGYVNDIWEVMDQNDLLITKPGGITLFEAISRQLPLIVKKPKIGQERYNSNFIESKEIGFVEKREKVLKDKIKDLLEHPEKIDLMKKNIQMIKDDLNCDNIGEPIIQLIMHNY